MIPRALPLLLVLAAPAPLLAQGAPDAPDARTFQPPQGCEAYVTVQYGSCRVSHHFRCAADPAGWQRRVDMDEAGVTYFGAVDGQTQWVESFHVLSDHSEVLAPDPADPASADELFATGRDTFDFTTLSDEIGPTRYVGRDELPGETATIDGVTLERTRFEIAAYDAQGTEVWRSEGSEYISRDWRMFIAGQGTTTLPDGTVTERDDQPVEFVFPDEPGFLSASPKHGCGLVVS